MTSLPAQRFGFTGRGLIREGMHADVIVFDPRQIAPKSTWREPRLLPKGIHHVLVNGQFAIRNGEPTGICAGEVVRGYLGNGDTDLDPGPEID
jgi:N-acyl-D-aspartate/D-glutamate deacylase